MFFFYLISIAFLQDIFKSTFLIHNSDHETSKIGNPFKMFSRISYSLFVNISVCGGSLEALFVAPEEYFKKILIKASHLKIRRFYIKFRFPSIVEN